MTGTKEHPPDPHGIKDLFLGSLCSTLRVRFYRRRSRSSRPFLITRKQRTERVRVWDSYGEIWGEDWSGSRSQSAGTARRRENRTQPRLRHHGDGNYPLTDRSISASSKPFR